jgi:hypothetical protein
MAYHTKVLGLGGAVALSVFAAGASAGTVNLKFEGPSTGGSISSGKQVNITDVPLLSPVAKTGDTYAFGFNMNGGDALGDFLAWCLDLQYTLDVNTPRPYSITDTPFTNSYGLDAGDRGRVQAVFDANYGTLDAGDADQAAGFQLALWEVLYDEDFNLGTGDFQATAESGILGFADGFLSAADGYGDGRKFKLTFFESTADPKRQNLVAASPSPVPLPASALLLLGGLGGLGGLSALRRRKRSA